MIILFSSLSVLSLAVVAGSMMYGMFVPSIISGILGILSIAYDCMLIAWHRTIDRWHGRSSTEQLRMLRFQTMASGWMLDAEAEH